MLSYFRTDIFYLLRRETDPGRQGKAASENLFDIFVGLQSTGILIVETRLAVQRIKKSSHAHIVLRQGFSQLVRIVDKDIDPKWHPLPQSVIFWKNHLFRAGKKFFIQLFILVFALDDPVELFHLLDADGGLQIGHAKIDAELRMNEASPAQPSLILKKAAAVGELIIICKDRPALARRDRFVRVKGHAA